MGVHPLRHARGDRPSFENGDLSVLKERKTLIAGRQSDHFPEHFDHGVAFLVLQMRIHRQREYPLRLALRYWKFTLMITGIGAAAHGVAQPAVGNVPVDVPLRHPTRTPATAPPVLHPIP